MLLLDYAQLIFRSGKRCVMYTAAAEPDIVPLNHEDVRFNPPGTKITKGGKR
jgi:hypothetical protein